MDLDKEGYEKKRGWIYSKREHTGSQNRRDRNDRQLGGRSDDH